MNNPPSEQPTTEMDKLLNDPERKKRFENEYTQLLEGELELANEESKTFFDLSEVLSGSVARLTEENEKQFHTIKRRNKLIKKLGLQIQSLTEENQILRHELNGSAVNAGLVKQVAQQQQVMKEAVKVLQGVVDIMHGSDGVTGWHLNGDVATWDEFVEFITIHEALTKLKGEQGE